MKSAEVVNIIENNLGKPFVIDPVHVTGGVGEDVFLRKMIAVLYNIFPGFDMPKFVIAGADGVIGNREDAKKDNSEENAE